MSHKKNAVFPRENATCQVDGSKSAAREEATDADLQAVINRWQDLPEAIKAGILAMVNAAGGS